MLWPIVLGGVWWTLLLLSVVTAGRRLWVRITVWVVNRLSESIVAVLVFVVRSVCCGTTPTFSARAQVLTTYSILAMDFPRSLDDASALDPTPQRHPPAPTDAPADSSPADAAGPTANKTLGPIFRVQWFRVVLDEAQMIKNPRTQSARAAWAVKAKRRWCLSGELVS